MKNTFIISAIAATLAIPAMANITGSSSCTEGVLGTSTNGSTANVDANWSQNRININWYNGNTKVSESYCMYDDTITLPTQPTKPGYTFSGWRLSAAPAGPNCSAITDEQTCRNTEDCILNGSGALFGCRDAILVENAPYSKCSEITDPDTCLSIKNLDTYWNQDVCGWSNGNCYFAGWASEGGGFGIPESWCEIGAPYHRGYVYSGGRCINDN